MRNVGEIIFGPLPGEDREVYELRLKFLREKFHAVFNNPAGLEVLHLLQDASNPLAPRFGGGRTSEEAAFLDGERSLIGLLWLNGTTQKRMNHE